MWPPTLIHSWQCCSRDCHERSKMPLCCCLKDKGNETLFSINIPLPLTTITGLDRADHWLGLPRHQTSHQWTSSYGATLKPWFTHRHLILKRILSSVFLRQQQPGTFESQVSLCYVIVICASWSVSVHLNVCSKKVWNTTLFFPPNTWVVLLDFQP